MMKTIREHIQGNHSLVTVVLVTFFCLNLMLLTIDALASIIQLINNPVVRNQIYLLWLTLEFVLIFPLQWIAFFNSAVYQIDVFQNKSGVVLSGIAAIFSTYILFNYNFPGMSAVSDAWRIAKSKDQYELQIQAEGNQVILSGTLNYGSAKQVEKHLSETRPALVELNIEGGQLYEARRISDYVRAHNISVNVDRNCMTPCGLILASGAHRTIHADAKIGFQSYKILYPDSRSSWFEEREQEADIKRLISYGIVESFAYQTFYSRTKDEFWYPDAEMLLANGFVDQLNE